MSEWVGAYTLVFSDRVEGQVLHRGDREECERVVDLIPAVSVSTDERPEAFMHVMPADEWDALWEDSNQEREP